MNGNLKNIHSLLYAEKIAECKPQRIKNHRSDTDLLYLLGAEMRIYLCNNICGNMLSYITIKTTNTLNFENISELVRNELRQSYLSLFVQL